MPVSTEHIVAAIGEATGAVGLPEPPVIAGLSYA
jgi:hypothetical protein